MNNWSHLHATYKDQDWVHRPSLFAEWALRFFPSEGKLLDLGAGLGQDSRFFTDQGYDVTAFDIEQAFTSDPRIPFIRGDLRKPLPWKSGEFHVVYAHLSLHYFSTEETARILQEISRVLKKDGVFAALFNSVNDPEYNTGERIEGDYFMIDGVPKRYFSVESVQNFTQNLFTTLHVDEDGETYKDRKKGVHHLVRYIGKH